MGLSTPTKGWIQVSKVTKNRCFNILEVFMIKKLAWVSALCGVSAFFYSLYRHEKEHREALEEYILHEGVGGESDLDDMFEEEFNTCFEDDDFGFGVDYD